MSKSSSLPVFDTFGELLRHLRRRARLTQRDLGQAVGYSETQITRLENGQRLPDLTAVKGQFVEALDLKHKPELANRLIELAMKTRDEPTVPVRSEPGFAVPSQPKLTNLPAPLTRCIGREREIEEVKQLLSDSRLVTLTGSGGVGKTRLAIEVGAALAGTTSGVTFLDCVWLVELAALSNPMLVADTVATMLGLRAMSRSPLVVITEYLLDRRVLLILDNCEHLVDACAELAAALLRACPDLRILATSREPLNVPSEVTWRVPSLVMDEAIQLFAERAHAAKPGFEVTPANAEWVAQVCRRLDDIPLAIELAATRVRTFSVEQIAVRLDDVFRLLTGGSRIALPRQQTLQATIDWSYDLLYDEERALFRQLSVFAGGWTLEAAQAVAAEVVHGAGAVELLEQLVNKSLVVVEESPSGMRYRLLETIRQYAHGKLVGAGADAERQVRQRHLLYYTDLATAAASHFDGGPGEKVWADILLAEIDNVRAALSWAAVHGGWPAAIESAPAFLVKFLIDRGYGEEMRQWIDGAILSNPRASVRAQALGLRAIGYRLLIAGDVVGCIDWYRRASVLAHQLEDEELILLTDRTVASFTPDYAQAAQRLAQVIQRAHQAGRKAEEAHALCDLGMRMAFQGDYAQAVMVLEKSVSLVREAGDKKLTLNSLHFLGGVWLERADYARARAILEEGGALLREMPSAPLTLWVKLGTVGLYQGDVALAREALREFIPYQYRNDNLERVAQGLVLAAGVAQASGALVRATCLLAAAAAIRRDHHTHGVFERELFAEYDRRLPAVRAALDPADFDKAWAEGQKLTIKEAIAEALTI